MIRHATPADIARLLELGEAMHAESRYRVLPWSRDKVHRLLAWLIEIPDGFAMVAERNGEVVGGFIGAVCEHWCTDAMMASDYALFISPERRGGIAARRLVRAYTDWATARGVPPTLINIGITTGVNVESSSRLMQTCGYADAGRLFEYQGG